MSQRYLILGLALAVTACRGGDPAPAPTPAAAKPPAAPGVPPPATAPAPVPQRPWLTVFRDQPVPVLEFADSTAMTARLEGLVLRDVVFRGDKLLSADTGAPLGTWRMLAPCLLETRRPPPDLPPDPPRPDGRVILRPSSEVTGIDNEYLIADHDHVYRSKGGQRDAQGRLIICDASYARLFEARADGTGTRWEQRFDEWSSTPAFCTVTGNDVECRGMFEQYESPYHGTLDGDLIIEDRRIPLVYADGASDYPPGPARDCDLFTVRLGRELVATLRFLGVDTDATAASYRASQSVREWVTECAGLSPEARSCLLSAPMALAAADACRDHFRASLPDFWYSHVHRLPRVELEEAPAGALAWFIGTWAAHDGVGRRRLTFTTSMPGSLLLMEKPEGEHPDGQRASMELQDLLEVRDGNETEQWQIARVDRDHAYFDGLLMYGGREHFDIDVGEGRKLVVRGQACAVISKVGAMTPATCTFAGDSLSVRAADLTLDYRVVGEVLVPPGTPLYARQRG